MKMILALAVLVAGVSFSASADEYVRGYVRRDGRYVAPHFRSSPDRNFYNNYSSYPNVNPYTGSVGTRHYPTYGTSYAAPSYPSYRPYTSTYVRTSPYPSYTSYGSSTYYRPSYYDRNARTR